MFKGEKNDNENNDANLFAGAEKWMKNPQDSLRSVGSIRSTQSDYISSSKPISTCKNTKNYTKHKQSLRKSIPRSIQDFYQPENLDRSQNNSLSNIDTEMTDMDMTDLELVNGIDERDNVFQHLDPIKDENPLKYKTHYPNYMNLNMGGKHKRNSGKEQDIHRISPLTQQAHPQKAVFLPENIPEQWRIWMKRVMGSVLCGIIIVIVCIITIPSFLQEDTESDIIVAPLSITKTALFVFFCIFVIIILDSIDCFVRINQKPKP